MKLFSKCSLTCICLVVILSFTGCKDPIPPDANEKFVRLSAATKTKMEELLPKRDLILTNFRTECRLQNSKEIPVLGTIFVSYRGKESAIDKSNQVKVNYEYNQKKKKWMYRNLNINREILGEDLQDQDEMFDAAFRAAPRMNQG